MEVEAITSLPSRATQEDIRYDFGFYTPSCRNVRVKVRDFRQSLRFQKFDKRFFPSLQVEGLEINSFDGLSGNHQDLRNFDLHKR